jgi:hypothetical protein
MKEALAVCKVQVNPIELWQLEDKEYTIRVAGKESTNSTPVAGENVWIDVVLPQLTDAEAKQAAHKGHPHIEEHIRSSIPGMYVDAVDDPDGVSPSLQLRSGAWSRS